MSDLKQTEASELELIERAEKQLYAVCKDAKAFRMSIPPRRDDTDFLFQAVFDIAKRKAEASARPEAPALAVKVDKAIDNLFAILDRLRGTLSTKDSFALMNAIHEMAAAASAQKTSPAASPQQGEE